MPFSAVKGWLTSFRRLLCRGTIFSSIFTLLTTCIGAGTLALPYAIKQGGLIYSSFVFFVIMVISISVGLFLIESKRYSQRLLPGVEVSGYEDLAEITMGSIGRVIVLLTLVSFLILTLIAYMIYARDQLDYIFVFILDKTGQIPDCSILRNCGVIMVIAFLPLFPITLLRDLTPLQFTSTTSILCVGFLAIVVLIKLGQRIASDSVQLTKIVLFPRTFEGALQAVTYLSLSFVCQFQLFPLQKELYRPTKPRLYLVVIASSIFAYFLYNIVAIGGYLQYLDNTQEDIMLAFPSGDGLVTAARVALFFALIFSYPVLFHPTRATINALVVFVVQLCTKRIRAKKKGIAGSCNSSEADEGENLLLRPNNDEKPPSLLCVNNQMVPNKLVWFCETWVIFGSTFLVAVFIDNVGYVWNFVGSIGGTLVLFIYPPIFYLRLRYMCFKEEAVRKGVPVLWMYKNISICKDIIAAVILIIGVILVIVENYVSVYAIIVGTHQSSAGQCQQLMCNHSNYTVN